MFEFWSFMVLVFVFFETVSFFSLPISRLLSPLKKELEEIEEVDSDDGFFPEEFEERFFGCFLIFLFLTTYIVIPIITVWAIIKNVGYPIFNYINCLIILVLVVYAIVFIRNNLSKNKELKVKPKFGNLLRLFNFIQVAYVWYIFFAGFVVVK